MSDLGTLTGPPIHLETRDRLALTELIDLEAQAPAPGGGRPDFLATSQAEGTGAVVAEVPGRVVGLALYRAAPLGSVRPGPLKRLWRWCRPWKCGAPPVPRHLELLRIGVLPGWRRQGIGRALLRRLHQEFGPFAECIRAAVPEGNLPVQLLLRNAGYKAVRILPGHCGSEDGYLMEWRCR
jgi:ribosomal protein S18 acetylase RimI-like enzyme